MAVSNMSAMYSYIWSSIKIPLILSEEERNKTNQVNNPKFHPKVVNLKVPTPLWEEEENQSTIPYINNQNQTRRLSMKKREKIIQLKVPEIEEDRTVNFPLEDFEEQVEEELVSVPIVKRLSIEELQAVKFLMKERIKKKKNKRRKKGASKKQLLLSVLQRLGVEI